MNKHIQKIFPNKNIFNLENLDIKLEVHKAPYYMNAIGSEKFRLTSPKTQFNNFYIGGEILKSSFVFTYTENAVENSFTTVQQILKDVNSEIKLYKYTHRRKNVLLTIFIFITIYYVLKTFR